MHFAYLFFIILALILLQEEIFCAKLINYGVDEGDQEIDFSDDLYGVTLDIPINYFEENQNELFISSRGIVLFGQPSDVNNLTDLDDAKISAISMFFTPTSNGRLYLRATTNDDKLLDDLTNKIRKSFPATDGTEYTALYTVVITWDEMEGVDSDDGTNRYQMVLATDGISSYAILIYDRIEWTESHGQYAQAGLYFSDGRRETMVNSGTESIKELTNLSNNQHEGTYIFRISGSSPEDPRSLDGGEEYTYTEYEQEYDADEENTKAENKSPPTNCPPDPYHDHCPDKCQVLTDNRGCSLCVCEQPPESRGEQKQETIEENKKTPESLNWQQANAEEHILPKNKSPDISEVDEKADESAKAKASNKESQAQTVKPEVIGIQSVLGTFHSSKNDSEDTHKIIEIDRKSVSEIEKADAKLVLQEVEDPSLSCAGASEKIQPCNTHARCTDYNPGYCCECLEGYYGNGIECLKNDEPQRVNGYFAGVINGEELTRTELHTYMMVTEGRSYTALSQIPPHLGQSLLLLSAIGSAMGWLFAKVDSPSSYNGFELTGGLFNRTLNVHIGDRYAVTLKQHFSGRDIYHYFKANIFITGTLPKLIDGSEVVYSDHDEEYRREGPGFVRSYSSQVVSVTENGVKNEVKITVDQQIHYNECSFREFKKDAVVIVHVTRPHVVYDAEERIVRYASANTASSQRHFPEIPLPDFDARPQPSHHAHRHRTHENMEQEQLENENPCADGRHLCTQVNMQCAPVEHSYRCVCEKGYETALDSNSKLGWHCVDLNECERGVATCDLNAHCTNTDGSFECRCRDGFVGDGHRCQRLGDDARTISVDEKAKANRSGCLAHQDCHQWGECVFGRNGRSGYCKCRGWYVGDGIKHCGPPGEKDVKQINFGESQQERDENTCSGYICDSNADCVRNEEGQNSCVCRENFYGNGVNCIPHILEEKQVSVGTTEHKLCRSHEECGEHKSCVYNAQANHYRCECLPSYQANGMICEVPKAKDFPANAKSCREASDCHSNSHCVAREKSSEYFCECLPGFQGDGFTECRLADECNPSEATTCPQGAECAYEQTASTYKCRCLQGFTGDGRICLKSEIESCNERPQLCHRDAQCLYSTAEKRYICICQSGSVGDGYKNCRPEEISPKCAKCSSHARCVHHDDHSWSCRCKPGYLGNGLICTPYTSCLDDRSLCDARAECIPGEHGHYICNCHYGYHGDGRTCTPDSESREESLLVCRGMSIVQRSINRNFPGKQLIVVPHQIAVGIDFDCQQERIIWCDIAGHAILSSSINGTDVKKFLETTLKSPEGVAVDWSSRNVYYTDSLKDEIGVASLDGKFHKTLINEGLVNPRALAIDPSDKFLYYTDWHRQNPLIGRVRLDGTENGPFVTTDIHLPNGLTVLLERRELCWVDAGAQRLSCIGLDGHNRRIVYAPLEYPFGLTAHMERRFYWSDWSDNKIHSISVTGEEHTSFSPTIGGSGRIYGLVSVPTQCNGAQSACAVNNGGCEYLCLPGKHQVTCACPDNIARCSE